MLGIRIYIDLWDSPFHRITRVLHTGWPYFYVWLVMIYIVYLSKRREIIFFRLSLLYIFLYSESVRGRTTIIHNTPIFCQVWMRLLSFYMYEKMWGFSKPLEKFCPFYSWYKRSLRELLLFYFFACYSSIREKSFSVFFLKEY